MSHNRNSPSHKGDRALRNMLADEDALSDVFAGRVHKHQEQEQVNKIYEQYIEH